ncbi:hypothetical protein LPJ66_006530 [Kickxella alabastrina]|uniref:Uncharacterized protein n=1 Tax=Kickxella alabastrina TaxID=61397 RepID=A0ACC1IFG3_9FUNG|nr:hypothetical protein LPJ66_006530 [Kickxella alabastrina]
MPDTQDTPRYRVDIDALFADYVKDAQIESGLNSSEISRRLFVKAAALAAENSDLQITFIECRSREHLVKSIGVEPIVDHSGLDRISIKYVTSPDMFRALFAAWHCGAEQQTRTYSESDFLIWNATLESNSSPAVTDAVWAPDYMLIDGFDAVADESR